MKRVYTYWQVWYLTASNALQKTFIFPWTNVLFFVGKAIRFCMMLLFLFVLQRSQVRLDGYSADQIVIFFLTYQFIDVSTQVLFRGVYMFSSHIREGSFDSFLSKPVSPLFRALMGHPDINDALFLLPMVGVSIWIGSQLSISPTLEHIFWYSVLLLNGFLISLALHIFVLVAAILITEVDGVIWLYRDLIKLGQFPVSAYAEPLRSFLYFVIPVAFMITVPAETILGSVTWTKLLGSVTIGIGSLGLSVFAWKQALKQYNGAGG